MCAVRLGAALNRTDAKIQENLTANQVYKHSQRHKTTLTEVDDSVHLVRRASKSARDAPGDLAALSLSLTLSLALAHSFSLSHTLSLSHSRIERPGRCLSLSHTLSLLCLCQMPHEDRVTAHHTTSGRKLLNQSQSVVTLTPTSIKNNAFLKLALLETSHF